jgi:hypothetical protein
MGTFLGKPRETDVELTLCKDSVCKNCVNSCLALSAKNPVQEPHLARVR